MAANVTYSPAPAYPPAASDAHVQGEVKLEAEVDPDGNVASARVISGPPLLRDAAVNAVEHWHYRPYLAEGRPIYTNTQIVMDFQLP
jgi:TonB family protein